MKTKAEERKATPIDLVGKKFGRLTVVSKGDKYISPQGKIHNRWNCICECGNKTTPDTGNLNSGKSNSCGCFLTPDGLVKRQKTRKEYASAADVYSQYKINARKRGYEFKITKDEAIKIFKQKCHYCNCEPKSIAKKCVIPFIYNGIDRKDNSIGYTIDNCLPCCGRCNKAKMNSSYNDFLKMIEEIYLNLIKKND